MRVSFRLLLVALLVFCYASPASASAVFTANLSLGSRGAQVILLQQILNRDPDTRIVSTGPGSPGKETTYFGPLTRNAVIRFQEKYVNDVLTPVGLAQGNGYVGFYTRTKLNTLSTVTMSTENVSSPTTTPAPNASPASAEYVVQENERIDIYTGDKMIANVQQKILATINAAIASKGTQIEMPVITLADVPSVTVGELSPRSGVPGAHVSIAGNGVASNSVVYLGSNYIVRTVSADFFGNFSFVIPPIPPARYDVMIRTGNAVSNTVVFVVSSPLNPFVHLQSVSPATIAYGDTLTITGSGFSLQNNTVVTSYQTFKNIPSADGKTLTIQFTPESLQESVKIGNGTQMIPMSLYVVNDYGFSDSEKSFTMSL